MTTTLYAPREAAARTGLSLDTLRLYEKEGLVGPIQRDSGRRVYDEGDIAWIGLLSCLRDAGLGIADLRAFTSLLHSTDPTVDRAAFLRQRRRELQDRIATITVLDHKITAFETSTP